MADPRPRLAVEELASGRVALVMRRGVGGTDRVFGELPAKLRPVFAVAVALSQADIPSERWVDVVNVGIQLIGGDERFRHLLEPRDGGA